MVNFEKYKVGGSHQNIGLQLKEARESQRLTLTEASRQLKIKAEYLAALEAGRFNKLPSGVYVQSYLKQYAVWLGLPSEKLTELLDIELKRQVRDSGGIFDRQVVDKHYFLVIPRLIRYALIGLAALACLGYLSWLIANIYRPPRLNVTSPADKSMVSAPQVELIGETETESEITVNDSAVVVDSNGNFEMRLDLKPGLNRIIIVAQKHNKRKNVIIREVLYQKN